MNDKVIYIEDVFGYLLEHGSVHKNDQTLFRSFQKQTLQGMGFTDRQLELAKSKVNEYQKQLVEKHIDVTELSNTLRLPVRHIDRSRWIKIVDIDGQKNVAVRFTFSKKLISCMEQLRKQISRDTTYDKETKTHYFVYSERTLFTIIEIFKDKNFDLDETAKIIYDKICSWDPSEYVPGIYDNKLKNINNTALTFMQAELGEYSKETEYLYMDRRMKYGLSNFDQVNLLSLDVLTQKIIKRKFHHVQLNSQEYSLNKLVHTLYKLKRFPCLFLLNDNDCMFQISDIFNATKNIISAEQQSVMFRMSNSTAEGEYFNNFLKSNDLNGKLDLDKKIVYTCANNITKPLMASEWKPRCVIIYQTSVKDVKKALEFFGDNDLVIHYDTETSKMHRYYLKKDIQEL